MKCKKGDLALVIRGDDTGKVVKCIELYKSPKIGSLFIDACVGPVWVVDQDMEWHRADHSERFYIKLQTDHNLMPLRDTNKDKAVEETKQLHHA